MSYFNGPKIVSDGLVMCLDAANSKSYISGSSTWNDLSGNGNNGTLVNTPTFTSSFGGGIVFDGIDDYLSTNVNIEQTMTVSIWYRRKNSDINQTGSLFHASANNISTSNTWFELTITDPYYSNGGTIGIFGYSLLNNSRSDFLISPYPASILNQWRNMCISFNNSTGTAYMEGVNFGSSTPAFTAWNTATNRYPFVFGKTRAYDVDGGDYRFTMCEISNIQIYNRALSASEVLQNYNATKGRFGL
jgi:hypothetical protein